MKSKTIFSYFWENWEQKPQYLQLICEIIQPLKTNAGILIILYKYYIFYFFYIFLKYNSLKKKIISDQKFNLKISVLTSNICDV